MNAQISLCDEKILDSFAGGGGASTGIELAIGRVVDYAITMLGGHSLEWVGHILPPEISGMIHLNHIGLDYPVLCHPHGSGQRLFCVMHPWGLSLALPISHRDDKGVCGLDHELIHPTGHSAHSVGAKRPLGSQTILFLDFLPGIEN